MAIMDGRYDVIIIGAGLAGLSLARQLLLASDKRILMIDKRAEFPVKRQKIGEALAQVGGYYFSKVLDLEEHLVGEHLMKYNLRFYWKNGGRANDSFEDYSQAYIRSFSSIASYQLDRNKFEAELLRLNQLAENFTFCAPISDLQVTLSDDSLHDLTFRYRDDEITVQADWIVDTSGRGKVLTRRLDLARPSPIRHGSSFIWVDGLLDIEKLTDRSRRERRLHQDRSAIGHLPLWLATNHFMGEGFWFWVIPLKGKTSLGLVYDRTVFNRECIATPEKLIAWICREFPLLARDLPKRTILDYGSFKDFAYDCAQTIHSSKWALSGESSRFTDPLYSPASDFIAVHNTLITDAILTIDQDVLKRKCHLYELTMHSLYKSLIPTYAISYNVLGDQETFVLKYTWELSVYFSFFVFPFINDFTTNKQFILLYLRKFSRLGILNHNIQSFISDYYHWKQTEAKRMRAPVFHDFTSHGALRTAESMFYRVGVSVSEARHLLDDQLANLRELARFITVYVSSIVLADEQVLTNRAFIESINPQQFRFDLDDIRERYDRYAASGRYQWPFDPFVLDQFHIASQPRWRESAAVIV
jgi:flavin-dependent dehydrogenase